MYPLYISLHYQQGKVRWQNSSVEKARNCRRDSIRKIHIVVHVMFFVNPDHNTPLVCLVCGDAAPRRSV